MPIQHKIWKVGAWPLALKEAALPSEALLEEMIVAEPAILSDQWMIIGRQANTGFGGRIDLLKSAFPKWNEEADSVKSGSGD